MTGYLVTEDSRKVTVKNVVIGWPRQEDDDVRLQYLKLTTDHSKLRKAAFDLKGSTAIDIDRVQVGPRQVRLL